MSDDLHEPSYTEGQRAALRSMLSDILHRLGYDESLKAAHMVSEREAAIATLRTLCREHGDNDWPDNLHLSDIIEKHLGRHLE